MGEAGEGLEKIWGRGRGWGGSGGDLGVWEGLREAGEDLGAWERLGRFLRRSRGLEEAGEGLEEV